MKVIIRVLLFSTIFLLISSNIVQAEDIEIRPDPKGTPTEVKLALYLNDISKINNVDQTFTADFFVMARWKDPRLAGSPVSKAMKWHEIWNPRFRILNRRDIEVIDEDFAVVDPEGYVKYRQRIFGTLAIPLDLEEFPYDTHRLPIIVVSGGYGPDEVKFVVDKELTGRSKKLSIADWSVEDQEIDIDTFYFEPAKFELSQFTYSLRATRHVGFYVWRIIAPLIMIVFMSWMVFWIDPNHLEAQVGISATSVLTLVAFQFAVGHLLPYIAYLTRMDIFLVSSSILVFLALVEGVTTSALAGKGKRELALKFDRVSRFIFPIAFIIVLIVAFWL